MFIVCEVPQVVEVPVESDVFKVPVVPLVSEVYVVVFIACGV